MTGETTLLLLGIALLACLGINGLLAYTGHAPLTSFEQIAILIAGGLLGNTPPSNGNKTPPPPEKKGP